MAFIHEDETSEEENIVSDTLAAEGGVERQSSPHPHREGSHSPLCAKVETVTVHRQEERVDDPIEEEEEGDVEDDEEGNGEGQIVSSPAQESALCNVRPRVAEPDFIRARVTLKPRRTLSLSPTPGTARTYNMMAHNLSAAVLLDCIDKDADDGLGVFSYHNSLEEKTKTFKDLGRSGSLPLGLSGQRRPGYSMKRPLEVTLPCQEIQYLDISYQKVQFSPIPRKKIAYHPVPYHNIHYSECPCHCVSRQPESTQLLLSGCGGSLLDCGKRFC